MTERRADVAPEEERSSGRERPAERHGARWTLQVARVGGVPVRIHASFLLLLLYVWWAASATGRPAAAQLALVLGVFFCIVLHELGHVLAARRFGIPTRSITLYPIGGISRLESMGEPRQELVIALAGPLVSLAIGGGLWGLLAATGSGLRWHVLGSGEGTYLEWLAAANLVLAGFNLLPAFPTDGGRALRAGLALALGVDRATQVASAVGRAFAVVLGLLGLLGGNVILLLVAVFLFLGAQSEAAVQSLRSVLEGHSVRDAMVTEFATLRHDDTLAHAVERLLRGEQSDFPVLRDGRLLGILTRNDLVAKLAEAGGEAPVESAVEGGERALAPDADLARALDDLLRDDRQRPRPVMRGAELVGLLTWENLMEFVAIERTR